MSILGFKWFFSVPFPGGMIAQHLLKKKTLGCLNLFQPNVAIHFVQCSNAVSSKAAPEHHAATTMFESIVFLGSKDSLWTVNYCWCSSSFQFKA